ncbi:MAG: DUF11 domain-containing protein [Verrucomicrobiota bacterium]
MNFNKKLFTSAVVLLSLLFSGLSSHGQFRLGVSAAPNPVQFNTTLTYTIYLTNTTLGSWPIVYVTNKFSAPVIFTGQYSFPTNQQAFTNSTEIIFPVTNMIAPVIEFSFTLLPQTAGALTNQITALVTNNLSTLATSNYFTQVSAPTADLAITMTNVTSGVIANSPTTIGLTITNLGPNAAADVVVTNTLPANFQLLSITPTNAITSYTNGILAWTIGALTNNSSTQLLVMVRPTLGGTSNLTATVTASTADPNTTNNTATTSMTVEEIVSTNTTVVVQVAQQFNPQTGLMEEIVRVQNTDTIDFPAVRLFVSGLGTNRLYNASGTNNGEPYVQHNSTLVAGATVDLRLEYFSRTRTSISNLTYRAVGLTFTPTTITNTTYPAITNVRLISGGLLLEFQSIPGRSYTILYGDDPSLTNAMAAQPAIVAPADRVQWIDSGPPKTISVPPGGSNSRYYRVQLNP